MKFIKMQGCGNDYVYIDCFNESVKDESELARAISDRHFGVGGDGLVLMKPSTCGDVKMVMYNADGSRGKMCGNASRCVAKYIYEVYKKRDRQIKLETDVGVKSIRLLEDEGEICAAEVNMGEPIFEVEKIPVNIGHEQDHHLKVVDKYFTFSYLSMGNPHAVTLVDNLEKLDVKKYGSAMENNEIFPEKINVEFVQIIDVNRIKMRVWERGSGETLGCGTGACAAVVVGVKRGLISRKVQVELLGGELLINWDEDSNEVFMTGPAKKVFQGEF